MAGPTTLTPAPIIGITEPFSLPPGPPQHDPIEGLPPAAAEKLRLCRDRSRDAHALCVPFSDIQEANTIKNDAERAYRRLVEHPQNGGYNIPETDRRAISAQQHLAKVTDDLRRLNERSELRAAAWRATSAPLAACEDYLRHNVPGNCRLEPIETEPPKLNKGEGIIDAIERLRRRCRELKADAHRVASSQYPANYTKAKMRQQISRLAEQGQPDVTPLVEIDGDVAFPTLRQEAEVLGGAQRALAFSIQLNSVALLCWLAQDEIVKRLDAAIDAETDGSALSHEERELRTAEIMADLVAVERDEAALTWSAIEQGLPIEHRADINPVALLGVRLVTTPRADASPETSPGYSWPWRR